jgi:hypothetical protein
VQLDGAELGQQSAGAITVAPVGYTEFGHTLEVPVDQLACGLRAARGALGTPFSHSIKRSSRRFFQTKHSDIGKCMLLARVFKPIERIPPPLMRRDNAEIHQIDYAFCPVTVQDVDIETAH